MKEMQKAAFNLDSYNIVSFKYTEVAGGGLQDVLSVKFEPSGKYYQKDGRFIVSFMLTASYGEGIEVISATMNAHFKFETPVEFKDLPDYFYRNSLAIIFPYLRAFVSTLTAVSNAQPFILPLLNLSPLEEPFKNATIVISG